MKKAIVCVLLFSLAMFSFAGDEERQVIEGNTLKDLDYGFILKRPTEEWTFLKQDSIKKMNPDAIAGLVNPKSKVFTTIVAEEIPEAKLEDYANLVIESQIMENKQILFRGKKSFGSREVYQFKAKGEINDVKCTYFTTVFRRGSFYFQVVSFWPTELAKVNTLEINSIHSSFDFIPGVKPKVRMLESTDKMYGVGWRMEKGVYQNAIYGFSLKLPSKEWRFMDAGELKDIHPDASLGLEHAQGNLYSVVIAEKIGNTSQEEYEKSVAGDFKEGKNYARYAKTRVRVAGAEVTQHIFRRARLAGMTFDVFIVPVIRNQMGFQIFSVCASQKGKDMSAQVAEVYAGISWLTDVQRQKLTKELTKLADIQRSVTRNECFRNHTYRNFSFGISISFPKGFLQHSIGMEARMENEDASLSFVYLEHDLLGTLALEESDEFNGGEYHKLVLELLEPPEGVKTEKLKTNGVEVLSTRFPSKEDDLEFTYHLATTSKKGKHLQLLMYGLKCNLEQTRDLEMKILRSIRFDPENIRATRRLKGGAFVCDRLGFKVTPSDREWLIADMTPAATRVLGTLVMMIKPGVKALCAAGAVHASVNVDGLISAIFSKSDSLKDLNVKLVSRTSTRWLGLDAWLYKYEGKSGTLEKEIEFQGANLGGTYYLLITVRSKNEKSPVNFKDCFKLIP